MCSKASPDTAAPPPDGDIAARLGSAIDELAAAAGDDDSEATRDLTAQLAAAWALVAEADPELAERTARYAR
jgi:hypothetical protein